MSRAFPHSRSTSCLSYSLIQWRGWTYTILFWHHKRCTDGFCDIPNFFCPAILEAIVHEQPFLGFFRDVGSGESSDWKYWFWLDIQRSLEDAPHCHYLWSALAFSTVRGPWCSGSSFNQMHRYILTRLSIQATWKHPHCLLLSSILGWSWALPGLPQTWHPRIKAIKSSLG